jgi:integrase
MGLKVAYNAKAVEALREPGQYAVEGQKNLWLFVGKTGGKVWKWRGRVGGQPTTETLGPTTAHSMKAAADWAARMNVDRTVIAEAKVEKKEAAIRDARTVDWMFEVYMSREGGNRRSADEKRRIYNREFKPALGDKSIFEVDHDDFARLIDAKFVTSPIMSNAMTAMVKRWWRWAVTKGRTETGLKVNPTIDLVKLAATKGRDRYFDEYEIGLFLRAINEVDCPFRDQWTLILYTATRKEEAFAAEWSEFDLDKGNWLIPKHRSKNGRELLLALPPTALAMMRRLAVSRPKGQKLVWASKQRALVKDDEERPMSGFSKIIKRTMNHMVKLAAKDGKAVEHWTTHDLRRTVGSGMNGLLDDHHKRMIDKDHIERVLNHTIAGPEGVYDRWDYYAEKRHALAVWGEHVDAIATIVKAEAGQDGLAKAG